MMTLQQISELTGARLLGSADLVISGVETVTAAGRGDITFAINATHLQKLAQSQASAAIVSSELADSLAGRAWPMALLLCEEPQTAFAKIARTFRGAMAVATPGISEHAWVAESARIGRDVSIYPGAFVGENVIVGDRTRIFPGATLLDGTCVGADVTIFPNAVLYENTIVADDCVIHSGAVLGAWGFGYQSDANGHHLSDQLGHVELGERVEVGACATIDRGTYGATRIGHGSKLDNQVMIGHNCQVGSHNLLCSQVGIAGSSETGAFVVMAGQVGIADHVVIGDHAILCAKSGVMHDLPGSQTYLGAPAMVAREKLQVFAAESKLPEMRKQLRRLEKRVESLLATLADTQATPHHPSTEERKAA